MFLDKIWLEGFSLQDIRITLLIVYRSNTVVRLHR